MKTKLISLLIISAALVCNAAFAESGYIQHVRKNAEAGQAWAEKAMGDVFYFGIDMEADYEKAFEWYRKAAKQGDSTAMHAVGRSYYFGEGVEENNKKAAEWYREASESGDAESLYSLARMYEHGLGVKKDIPKAEDLYLEGIFEHENTDLFYPLARMYMNNPEHSSKMDYLVLLHLAYYLNRNAAAGQVIDGIDFKGTVSPSHYKEIWEKVETIYNEASGIEHDLVTQNALSNISVRMDVSNPPIEPLSSDDVYDRVWRSVVYIHVDGIFSGSGVIVQPDIVATNCHVVDDAEGQILVYHSKEQRGRENIPYVVRRNPVRADGDRDYCLLHVPGLPGSGVPATIRPYNTLEIGETVYALGAPDGEILSLSKGIISQLRDHPTEGLVIQSDVDIAPGSSGGGLFDGAGNLIGHTTFGSIDEREIDLEGLEFSVPADIVQEFE